MAAERSRAASRRRRLREGESSRGDVARRRWAARVALRARGVEPGNRAHGSLAPPLGPVRRSGRAGDDHGARPGAGPHRGRAGPGDGGAPADRAWGGGLSERTLDRHPRRAAGCGLVRWIGEKDGGMANTTDVVSAIRELTNTKQLERAELQ